MLEDIVFLIWDVELAEKAAELKRNIGAGGEAVHIWSRDAAEDDAEEDGRKGAAGCGIGQLEEKEAGLPDGNGRQGSSGQGEGKSRKRKEGSGKDGKEPRCLETYSKENTLFITDKGILLQELKRMGRYAVALLHDGNGDEDFAGASYAVTDIEELTMDSFDKAYRRMAGLPWTVLETERCIIRETMVEDVDEFYRIYAEPSITCYMDKLYDTPEEERAYTEEYIKRIYGFYGYGMWSIVRKETGRVMGRAGLSWREGFGFPEIGFVIEVPCQRKGYAYEVCSAIMEYGKAELGFGEIQALVEPGNTASVGLCRKLGMEWADRVEDGGKEYDRFIGRSL